MECLDDIIFAAGSARGAVTTAQQAIHILREFGWLSLAYPPDQVRRDHRGAPDLHGSGHGSSPLRSVYCRAGLVANQPQPNRVPLHPRVATRRPVRQYDGKRCQ